MSELNDFLKVLSEGKKQKEQRVAAATESLSGFLGAVAEAKAQDPKHQMMKEVKKNVREDIAGLFGQLAQAKPTSIQKVEEVKTIVIPEQLEPIQEPTVLTEVEIPEIKPAAEVYTKGEIDDLLKRNASFQQPEPKLADPNIAALQQKLKFLEQAIGKIAATGPGSGEVNLRWLDDVKRDTIADGRWLKYSEVDKKFIFDEINPYEVVYNTTEVTTSTYTVDDNDYYIGVNYAGPVTITLPASANSGRMLIIKDEDGDAEINPITVLGTVDNDSGGFIIQINNGAIQMIYRNGWRIV